MVKVKICGLTNLEDALMCSQQGADALGFIFVRSSPRYINPPLAKEIIPKLGPWIVKVGIFMDEDKDRVFKIAKDLKLNVLQFHGRERPSYCYSFKKEFAVIKVFWPDNLDSLLQYRRVDGFLLDVRGEDKRKGLTIIDVVDWEKVNHFIREGFKIIISGGIDSNNLGLVLKKVYPYGIDVARGVERSRGKKDRNKVKEIIRIAKSFSYHLSKYKER